MFSCPGMHLLKTQGHQHLGEPASTFSIHWTVDISQEEPQSCFSTIYCVHIYNREQLLVKGQKTVSTSLSPFNQLKTFSFVSK